MKLLSRVVATVICMSAVGCSGLSESALHEDGRSALLKQRQFISKGVSGARELAVADIDVDGYMDVLATSEYEGEVFWFRNRKGDGFADGLVVSDTFDSAGSFDGAIILARNVSGATAVEAADLDHDEDMDTVAVAETENSVFWFENTKRNPEDSR